MNWVRLAFCGSLVASFLPLGCHKTALPPTSRTDGNIHDGPPSDLANPNDKAEARHVIDSSSRIDVGPTTCRLVAGERSIDFLADPHGCPSTLVAVDGRCDASRVQQTACRDYARVDFSPSALVSTQQQFLSSCFYSLDNGALFGGTITSNPYSESPVVTSAGMVPNVCAQPCSASTVRCDGGRG
jgi:hypothetical protein